MDITQWLNQNSYLVAGILTLLVLASIGRVWRRRRAWLVWGLAAILLSTGWLALRTGAPAQDDQAIQSRLSSGTPTLVQLYSDYCLACLSLKPAVDELEHNWTGGQVIRLDVSTPAGHAFAAQHDFRLTPTFILFDANGSELARWVLEAPGLDELP